MSSCEPSRVISSGNILYISNFQYFLLIMCNIWYVISIYIWLRCWEISSDNFFGGTVSEEVLYTRGQQGGSSKRSSKPSHTLICISTIILCMMIKSVLLFQLFHSSWYYIFIPHIMYSVGECFKNVTTFFIITWIHFRNSLFFIIEDANSMYNEK